MNLALMSHDRRKELMVQFCIAYCGILSKHTVCATNTTGKLVAEATGLPVNLFLSHEHGGIQQIGARIAYNEIDMVLFFTEPQSDDLDDDVRYIRKLCDQYNIPLATNVATAEMLILGLERGDLDWRDIVSPKTAPFRLVRIKGWEVLAARMTCASSGTTPRRGRPAASMASSMVVLSRRISLGWMRFITKWMVSMLRPNSVTVRCASRRAEESLVETTTARSAPQEARRKPEPRPAGESMST